MTYTVWVSLYGIEDKPWFNFIAGGGGGGNRPQAPHQYASVERSLSDSSIGLKKVIFFFFFLGGGGGGVVNSEHKTGALLRFFGSMS